MIKRNWIEGELSIFILKQSDGSIIHLNQAELKRIEFDNELATLNILVPLPEGFKLLRLNNGETFILQDTICGDRSKLNSCSNSIRVDDCKIEKRWIENVNPNRQDEIMVNIIVFGLVSYYD